MVKKTKQENDYGIVIGLPIRSFSELSHLKNINYCIKQIKKYSENGNNVVVGYITQRALGTKHINHRVIEEKTAKKLKKTNPRFNYHTLDDFLKKQEEIKKGKYMLHRGLIIDINPNYVH